MDAADVHEQRSVISLTGVQVPTVFNLKRANGCLDFLFQIARYISHRGLREEFGIETSVDSHKLGPAILPSDGRGVQINGIVDLWIPPHRKGPMGRG